MLLRSTPSALRWLGKIAAEEKTALYLVGGAIRDMVLGKRTRDLDLACEGSVKKVASRLSKELSTPFTHYQQFMTATLEGPEESRIDIAETRRETYPAPGALPEVEKASIMEDLYRRDFTVNAMALSLNPRDFGEIIDPTEGMVDLRKRLIRVLHEKSFSDDPTRVFRAVRYAERLGFRIESRTLVQLKGTVEMIHRLSPERLFYELQCISREAGDARVRIIKKLRRLNALSFLGEALKPLSAARLGRIPDDQACEFLCLFLSHFTDEYASRLPVKKACLETTNTLRKVNPVLAKLAGLSSPSSITRFLSTHDKRGLRIISQTSDSKGCRKIKDYLEIYSKVRIKTTGDDLKKMGISPGPRYRRILDDLLDAKLNGVLETKRQETEFVKKKEN